MDSTGLGVLGFLSLFALLFGTIVFYSKQQKVYDEKYKNTVVKKLLNGISNDIKYTPSDSISQQEFMDSDIFLQKIRRYEAQDLIETTFGKTNIKFSTVNALPKNSSKNKKSKDSIFQKILHYEGPDSIIPKNIELSETGIEFGKSSRKGANQKEVKPFFEGVFLIADSPKHVNGSIVLLPDLTESLLGGSTNNFRFKKRKNAKLVIMDNTKFEKKFQVYSEDPIEAQYILTPTFLEHLVEFRENTKLLDVRMSMKKDKTYLSFRLPNILDETDNGQGNKKIFEVPELRGNPDFRATLKRDYNYLQLILSVVQILGLNDEI